MLPTTNPFAGIWAGQYFDVADQVKRAGAHQFITQIVLPILPFANTVDAVKGLAPYAAALKLVSDNHWPLILRHSTQISQQVLLRGTTQDSSAAAWKKLPDGTLARTTTYSMLAPTDQWAAEGKEHGASLWMAEMQRLCPTPGGIFFADNHESGVPDFGTFTKGTPLVSLRWKTKAEIQAMDVRLADWIETNGGYGADPYAAVPALYLKTRDLYAAYFAAFRAGITAWKDLPFQTIAYSADGPTAGPDAVAKVGPYPEALPFTGHGTTLYPGEGVVSSNLLDPGWPNAVAKAVPSWQWSRNRSADVFRVVWFGFNSPDPLRPVQAGWHEATTPDIAVGWCSYMAWLAREPGVPLLLYYWTGNATKPGAPIISDPAWIDVAKSLNRPDLLTLTQEQYAMAPALACDLIARPEIAPFWQQGTTIPIATTGKAAFVAVKLDDRILLVGFQPYHTTGAVQVTVDGKTVTLDFGGQPWGYWIASPPPPPAGFVVEKVE